MIIVARDDHAKPKSASQTSPGCGLIEQIQDFLLRRSRAHQIEYVLIGNIDDLGNKLPDLGSRLRLPLAQFGVEFFSQSVHSVPSLLNAKLRRLSTSTF
jgi:hypothetical protein